MLLVMHRIFIKSQPIANLSIALIGMTVPLRVILVLNQPDFFKSVAVFFWLVLVSRCGARTLFQCFAKGARSMVLS